MPSGTFPSGDSQTQVRFNTLRCIRARRTADITFPQHVLTELFMRTVDMFSPSL